METTREVRRGWRLAVTCGVIATLAMPVLLNRDSLPLSTYPMYATARSTTSVIVTAQGIDGAGERRALTPTLIGNSDDPLIVVGELRAALNESRGDVRCAEIAMRVAERRDFDDVVAIEIVSERHDTIARVSGDDSLLERDVRAQCEVEG